jgi:predicted transcriptional regulator of viral defense system
MSDMEGDRRQRRQRLFHDIAADQRGYFTAAQARDVGYSYQAQAHHVAVGNWIRVDRGLFRLAEWVPEVHDELARWALWSSGRGVISHESALGVHQVGEFEAAKVHLTVPRNFTMTDPAVVIHRVSLEAQDVVDGGGFSLTSATRSLIDVAATGVDLDQLARAIDEARERGLVSIKTLRSRAEAIDLRAALAIERAIALRAS